MFVGLWTALNFSRKLFLNIIFIVIFLAFISVFLNNDNQVTVPANSALVLKLSGNVVIEKESVDPFTEFMEEAFEQEDDNPEILLQDILLTIENAKQDRRIKALVLDLHGLGSAGLDKLEQIAVALEAFKESEKPIYAIGDYYTQNQYYLASRADHLYLNPMGFMMFEGYGRFGMYFKSAIEKLKAETHVFKVGTYKSAVESYIRDDMSDAAKEANKAWLTAMWIQYKTSVAEARGLDVSHFDEELDVFLEKFEQSDGDFAQYALDFGWVDALKTREQALQEIVAVVGKDESGMGFNGISYKNYLRVINPVLPNIPNNIDKVAIVVAKGTILNGTKKAGQIGGDSTAELLRKARYDDTVKSVVLYVDSPGGSAFASEIIRQEVENLQAIGKPVVAVMSTYAASGGYWISAGANRIIAAPSTITGSIGIFGMFLTFENTLDYLGVHTDGVGTTEFAGMGITKTLNPKVAAIMQRGIEHGYDQFISLVADKRGMSKDQVDQIAQGRVWIGETALELGLVDELGYLDDGVKAAAELANLESYDTQYIQKTLSKSELFWKELFQNVSVSFEGAFEVEKSSTILSLVKELTADIEAVATLNDPKGVYAYCLACEL
ncbi:signal peptide peptidase SppA, 67K type [Paraglaciecola psychrophila 170]|uniref:Signal peptide peptidase SppA, 67K type n=1 Tax=Paraglaciecola psychrophila 170 TaxID=1129794 RepID=K7ADZ5_9ALTE|nr:signal peptide peptidase SppA, 67K type [Paraglaciecola psychrophila 170]GAC40462.1 protease IV [Paraglaciecola psychrophila 170]